MPESKTYVICYILAISSFVQWPCNLLLPYISVRKSKHCKAIGQLDEKT